MKPGAEASSALLAYYLLCGQNSCACLEVGPLVNRVDFFLYGYLFPPRTYPVVHSTEREWNEWKDFETRALPETCNNVQQNIFQGHAASCCGIFIHLSCYFMTTAL